MTLLSQLAPGGLWARLALSVIVQVTIVILVAALAARAIPARHAAARHGLWLGTLTWVLLSPFIATFADLAEG